MTTGLKVGLIGAGAMGGALFRGWLKAGVIDAGSSAIFDPALSDDLRAEAEAASLEVNPPPAGGFDALVIAVKPQASPDVLPAFVAAASSALCVSVMAGRSIASVAADFGGGLRIIRAMPNLPALYGVGVTALYAPPDISGQDRARAEALLSAVGETVWVESEAAIDAVTAVSGSGPAYFMALTEALAEAAVAVGLPEAVAAQLARATAIGAGAMLAGSEHSAAEWRARVTSKGGTTAAALSVLDGEDAALRTLLRRAVERATARAGEMRG